MSKAKFVLLSLVAVLSAGVVFVSSASAAIEFKWKVGGAELKAGETRGFTVNNDEKKFDFHFTIAGAAALLLATLVEVLPGAQIVGGVPGTNEETALFLGVTVDSPANCGVIQAGGSAGRVQTVPLKTEIVEGATAAAGNNEVEILFIPKTGTTFATFELTGASCLIKGTITPVSGSVLALALPQKTEVLRQNLVFEPKSKEYHNHAGEFKTAQLLVAGAAATLEGLVLVILNSDAVFAPF
jgi:hypothetical protein